MNKRGLNQVDWVISLAIFLLYIAWFFIFLKPQIVKTADLAPLQSIIEDNLDDLDWQVNKTPVFVSSSQNKTWVPVFINYTPGLEDANFGILDGKDFFYSKGRLLFLEDFNNSTTFYWIVESNSTYYHNNSRLDIIYDGNVTTSKNFSVEFTSGKLKNLEYKNQRRLNDTRFFINSHTFSASNISYVNHNLLVEYTADSQPLTLFSRIVAENSFIWFYAILKDEDFINDLTLRTGAIGFEEFYSDNNNFGDFASDHCVSYKNNYLKLNSSEVSLIFILPENSNITFCNNGTNIDLNITISMYGDREFFIISGDSSYEKEDFYNYSYSFGIKKRIEGVRLETLEGLDYDDKKSEWGYPVDRNFQIIVWNGSLTRLENRSEEMMRIGPTPLTNSVVYAKEHRKFLLSENGKKSEITVNVNTW